MTTTPFTGYYTYNNTNTINKYEIITTATDPKKVHWNFHDDFFMQYNWSIEPHETIDELYRNRAQEIRDTYDYIILFYSGGADSQNVLDTFTDYNIFLDEIVSFVDYNITAQKNNALNHEILTTNGAKDRALRSKHNNTIYRLYDITQYTINRWKSSDIHSWSNNTRPRAGRILDTNVDKWKSLYNQGKKIAFIWGNYKPQIIINNNQFYFHFTDALNSNIPFRESLTRDNASDEQFYHYPSHHAAQIIIKQSHLIKHALSNPTYQSYLIDKYKQTHTSKLIELELYHASDNLVFGNDDRSSIIYPKFNKQNYINIPTAKHNSTFISQQEKWFWNANTDTSKRYIDMIHAYKQSVKPQWINHTIHHNNKELIKRILNIPSRLYKI